MKILHIDSNHEILAKKLNEAGFRNEFDLSGTKEEIMKKIHKYDGLVVRSRFPIDKSFLKKATNLKCIGRVGAGMENIDVESAKLFGIQLFNAPEGNANAVAEHAVGLLLSIMNNFRKSDIEVRNGKWFRETNRGEELSGKTVGLIGYGNNGKAFARKLKGFDVKVLCVDILPNVGDEFAEQVTMDDLFRRAEILSLHVPLTPKTKHMVNANFLKQFKTPIYFINIARGACVVTKDLLNAIENGNVKAAGLDVLENEQSSFEAIITVDKSPEIFEKLINNGNLLLTPHIAGWTKESKVKLAVIIADKIIQYFTEKKILQI